MAAMQLKKASNKTTKTAPKSAAAGEKIIAADAPAVQATKSARATKPARTKKEGAEMTSGKNLHKAATPAVNAVAKTLTSPHVEAKPAVAAKPVEHHEIAQLAYSYYVERGHLHGYAEEDWLRAEFELRTL